MGTRPVANEKKWLYKACPRCHGDMYRESAYNEYVCLQCGGYVQYAPDPERLKEQRREKRSSW